MPVREVHGDLFDAHADALVNTVNCVGVMGKGVALQFKRRFPAMFLEYKKACERKEVRIGRMHVWETGLLQGPAYVINFPTKQHWKGASKLEWIEDGLIDLRRLIVERDIRSIAVPPLGAGNGGLDWPRVEPLIREALGDLDADVMVFPPSGAVRSIVGSTRIRMTLSRALVLSLMQGYSAKRRLIDPWDDTNGVSHLEIQKLMYVADVLQPSLRLEFVPGHYGPYSDKVRLIMQGMEGRYTLGFGDGTAKVLSLQPISVSEEGERELDSYLELGEGAQVAELTEQVLAVTDGFEDPYGVELLASTLFILRRDGVDDQQSVVQGVRSWTPRKGRIYSDEHVAAALDHLESVAI